ncbi:prepilin peptidase [Rhizohabitans arisaemae]|uniref:prepilin peptidase n=1 Tax=Rhizohabitans arisaemae TaxID=2720610 RepID=UPI0024B09AF7|nr:prepilin peptidase [Rhizohabitans arisaemae]
MAYWVVVAVVVGLAAGVLVRRVADGFAPVDEGPGPRLRLVWPPWIEVGTAAAAGLVVWRVDEPALLPAYLSGVLAGSALAVVDRRIKRLPDPLTLTWYPVAFVLLAAAAPYTSGWPGLLAAISGMAGLLLIYGIFWLIKPDGLGFGDVKLAGVLGLLLGRLGWDAWLIGAFAGHLLAALYAVLLLATRRATWRSDFPFGPFMLLGALMGACLA